MIDILVKFQSFVNEFFFVVSQKQFAKPNSEKATEKPFWDSK